MFSITLLLIAITALISFYAWKNTGFFNKWLFNPYRVYHQKEYYRFLSSGFIHSDTTHLLFNMLTFYFFGRKIEYDYQYHFWRDGYDIVSLYLSGGNCSIRFRNLY